MLVSPEGADCACGAVTGWEKWWLVNGGDIHRVWKYRKYTQLRQYAEQLPFAAWKASRKALLEFMLALRAEGMKNLSEASKGPGGQEDYKDSWYWAWYWAGYCAAFEDIILERTKPSLPESIEQSSRRDPG